MEELLCLHCARCLRPCSARHLPICALLSSITPISMGWCGEEGREEPSCCVCLAVVLLFVSLLCRRSTNQSPFSCSNTCTAFSPPSSPSSSCVNSNTSPAFATPLILSLPPSLPPSSPPSLPFVSNLASSPPSSSSSSCVNFSTSPASTTSLGGTSASCMDQGARLCTSSCEYRRREGGREGGRVRRIFGSMYGLRGKALYIIV